MKIVVMACSVLNSSLKILLKIEVVIGFILKRNTLKEMRVGCLLEYPLIYIRGKSLRGN